MPQGRTPPANAPAAGCAEHDTVLAGLIASTKRCVASAIKWGVRDVGQMRVLLTSDATCLALHECVSHYTRLLREAGESDEEAVAIVLRAVDLGSVDVSVQTSIRGAVREWALEAWNASVVHGHSPLVGHALRNAPDALAG
jgi:hypothetical protein